jgi:hypothetical protein
VEHKWVRAFPGLEPEAQRLVRAFAVLKGSSLSLASVAAVLEVPQPRAAEITTGLAATGWGTVTEDRFEITPEARYHLPELVPDMSQPEIDQVLAHVATVAHTHTTASGMPPAIRTDTVTLLQAASQHRRFTITSTVARAAWRSPTIHEDLDWTRELACYGENAAIAARQPELFIELLNNSADTYSSAADWPGAERAWLRALAIVEDLSDTPRAIHFLQLLTTNYLNWDQPHRALDMQLEVVAIHERADDPIKTAEAMATVARIMTDGGRTEAAIEYLKRANHTLRTHPHPEAASLHATILGDLGQTHARLGRINSARTYYRRALALVIDTDEETANRIRAAQTALSTR